MSAGREQGTESATVLGYFQKLPKKYLIPQEGYDVFYMCIENAVDALCNGEWSCTIDEENVKDSWDKHGDEILHQFDMLHQRALDIYTETTLMKNRQKIADILADKKSL